MTKASLMLLGLTIGIIGTIALSNVNSQEQTATYDKLSADIYQETTENSVKYSKAGLEAEKSELTEIYNLSNGAWERIDNIKHLISQDTPDFKRICQDKIDKIDEKLTEINKLK